jgi:hypothetical protein
MDGNTPLAYATLATLTASGQSFSFVSDGTATGWSLRAVDTHTHTASQVTDFTTAAAAAAPVQSVNGNTGTVTVAVPAASTATPQALGVAAAGTSNDFARADHVHALPTAADIGAVADDDSRLTDTRDPNAHAASHLPEGDDELFDQSLNTDDAPTFASVSAVGDIGTLQMDDYGLVWEGSRRWDVETGTFNGSGGDPVLFVPPDIASANVGIHTALDFLGEDAATNAATTLSNLGGAATDDIPDPSSATPQALGTAAAGTSADFARADHVHALPTAGDIGAVADTDARLSDDRNPTSHASSHAAR